MCNSCSKQTCQLFSTATCRCLERLNGLLEARRCLDISTINHNGLPTNYRPADSSHQTVLKQKLQPRICPVSPRATVVVPRLHAATFFRTYSGQCRRRLKDKTSVTCTHSNWNLSAWAAESAFTRYIAPNQAILAEFTQPWRRAKTTPTR